MRVSYFVSWVITRRKVFLNRRFGPIFKGQIVQDDAWLLKRGTMGSLATSDSNHLTPRNNPEDGRIKLNRGQET
jgi:hypothetical protein